MNQQEPQKADQTPSSVIRLASSQALKNYAESRPGLSRRSTVLLEAIRSAAVTDPSAGGSDRLRHLAAGLRDEINRHAIERVHGSAGETVPGLTRGFDASDQYFLVYRDDRSNPVDVLIEALMVSAASVLDDIVTRGSTLTDLERCSLVMALCLAASMLEEAISQTS